MRGFLLFLGGIGLKRARKFCAFPWDAKQVALTMTDPSLDESVKYQTTGGIGHKQNGSLRVPVKSTKLAGTF